MPCTDLTESLPIASEARGRKQIHDSCGETEIGNQGPREAELESPTSGSRSLKTDPQGVLDPDTSLLLPAPFLPKRTGFEPRATWTLVFQEDRGLCEERTEGLALLYQQVFF